MNLLGTVVKKAPWAKIGEVALTVVAATITAVVNRRNQERAIEAVGTKVAKEVIKQQKKMMP